MRFNLSLCSFTDHISGVISKKSVPNIKSRRVSPVSWQKFYVLSFIFRSVLHFESVLVTILEWCKAQIKIQLFRGCLGGSVG